MKYLFIVLICLPIKLMAQSISVTKDTLIKSKNHYLIKDGNKYLFTHEQWLKMTVYERVKLVNISDIKDALKRKGYYQGEINNKMDDSFKKAWSQYYMDKGFPTHANIDVFKSLGLLD